MEADRGLPVGYRGCSCPSYLPCFYWSDGEHAYTPIVEADARHSQIAKHCACGAMVERVSR